MKICTLGLKKIHDLAVKLELSILALCNPTRRRERYKAGLKGCRIWLSHDILLSFTWNESFGNTVVSVGGGPFQVLFNS